MVNIAFSAPKFRLGGDFNTTKICNDLINNQLFTEYITLKKPGFIHSKSIGTLFEFNRPISKKGAWISKDFEKNSTDFEGFETVFSTTSRLILAVGNFRINRISVLLPNYRAFLSSRDFSGRVTPNSQPLFNRYFPKL
jgi:hypothetical protein